MGHIVCIELGYTLNRCAHVLLSPISLARAAGIPENYLVLAPSSVEFC